MERCGHVGFRIVKGGGMLVWPVLEKVDILSLELLTIDVKTPEVYTSKGVPVQVDGVAQIKVKGDDISIATASEQFLGKSTDEISNIATQTLEGPFARHSRHDDRRGDLPEPRCLRLEGAGSRGGRHGQHGPGHRQLHNPRHPRQPGLPRRAGQTAHRPGQAGCGHRPGRSRSRRDDPLRAGDAGRTGGEVRRGHEDCRSAARLPDATWRATRRR